MPAWTPAAIGRLGNNVEVRKSRSFSRMRGTCRPGDMTSLTSCSAYAVVLSHVRD
jgi:hypothetical protein